MVRTRAGAKKQAEMDVTNASKKSASVLATKIGDKLQELNRVGQENEAALCELINTRLAMYGDGPKQLREMYDKRLWMLMNTPIELKPKDLAEIKKFRALHYPDEKASGGDYDDESDAEMAIRKEIKNEEREFKKAQQEKITSIKLKMDALQRASKMDQDY